MAGGYGLPDCKTNPNLICDRILEIIFCLSKPE